MIFKLILIFLLICIFIGFSVMWSVLRVLFGISKSNVRKTKTQGDRVYDIWQQTNTSDNSSVKQEDIDDIPNINRRKMFDKNEGEYVDFEEVK